MRMRKELALIAAVAVTAALAGVGPSPAATKTKKPDATAPVKRTAPRPEDDQSYLFLSPGSAEPAGAPDYATRGSARFNQPWAMTVYDRLGDWPPGR
jgi:hypothetical protein